MGVCCSERAYVHAHCIHAEAVCVWAFLAIVSQLAPHQLRSRAGTRIDKQLSPKPRLSPTAGLTPQALSCTEGWRLTSSAGFSSRLGATGIAREPLRVGRSNSAKAGMSLEGRCEGCSDASLGFLEDRLLPPAASGLILQVHDPKV